ncbi:phage baseplate assembly protein W [Arthrobacter ginsengisoli]|uniref:Phage baseplate assembly protein W n=1 Tax=Arthrobacter ginsengisoli TaxID=1356565 RepID=A0ABU1U766_9MICC|nr:GPW/gp25 family protein [Arthrobacter ginsengisoli]MDR7081029.1 phage baseplate assembly protein W [Arthrobacter ginsengisoli]
MATIVDQWLGTGFGFPLRPETLTGKLPAVSGMELVRQSIATILDTDPGERIMLPGFGCGLRRYIMEPNSLATRTAMREEIAAALSTWEPRIRLTNVAVTAGEEPSLVWIEIAYQRLGDLRPDNLAYPFYLK